MEIKYLELILENCDSIRIAGKDICDIVLDSHFSPEMNDLLEVADTFAVEIRKNANIEYSPFGIKSVPKEFVFNRLSQGDITQIYISMYDEDKSMLNKKVETSYHCLVSWDSSDDNDFINKNQMTYTTPCGNLCLVISKDSQQIRDIFKNNIEY